MKNIKKIALSILVLASLTWACEKIETGYLSDYIKYQNPVLYLMPGTTVMTGPLMPDGSTMPLHVEMGEMRNAETGEVAEDLLTPRPVISWKALYDYETDTTSEQVLAKLETTEIPAFKLNNISGQLSWNVNTIYAEGTKYEFDLTISNVKGEKYYPNIGKVELLPFVKVTWQNPTRIRVVNQVTNTVIYQKIEDIESLIDGSSLIHTITKISDESAPGITVILKVLDKNGTPFNPAAGEVLGSWPGYDLPDYSNSSVDTEWQEDKIIYHFPVTPFPYPGSLWYRAVPWQYFYIPNEAIGSVDSEGLNDGQEYIPGDAHWANFRTCTFINGPGTWEIKIVFPNVTRS